MKSSAKRGGARPGAGRPKGDSKMIAFRAPGSLARALDNMENRTDFIRKTLSRALDRKDREPAGIGEVTAMSGISSGRTIPYFDIRVAAGFPVPLDNDEKSQEIDLLSLLCPNPEASYLIRVKEIGRAHV